MKILYAKSVWEMIEQPLAAFLDRAAADRFDAVEVLPERLGMEPARFRAELKARGLRLVSQVHTKGATPAEHRASLATKLELSAGIGADFASCHTGKDHFAFEDNVALFQHSIEVASELGLPVVHETHRGRALYSAPATAAYLAAVPGCA
jgi:sugar phosphate isomerase/epimerase